MPRIVGVPFDDRDAQNLAPQPMSLIIPKVRPPISLEHRRRLHEQIEAEARALRDADGRSLEYEKERTEIVRGSLAKELPPAKEREVRLERTLESIPHGSVAKIVLAYGLAGPIYLLEAVLQAIVGPLFGLSILDPCNLAVAGVAPSLFICLKFAYEYLVVRPGDALRDRTPASRWARLRWVPMTLFMVFIFAGGVYTMVHLNLAKAIAIRVMSDPEGALRGLSGEEIGVITTAINGLGLMLAFSGMLLVSKGTSNLLRLLDRARVARLFRKASSERDAIQKALDEATTSAKRAEIEWNGREAHLQRDYELRKADLVRALEEHLESASRNLSWADRAQVAWAAKEALRVAPVFGGGASFPAGIPAVQN